MLALEAWHPISSSATGAVGLCCTCLDFVFASAVLCPRGVVVKNAREWHVGTRGVPSLFVQGHLESGKWSYTFGEAKKKKQSKEKKEGEEGGGRAGRRKEERLTRGKKTVRQSKEEQPVASHLKKVRVAVDAVNLWVPVRANPVKLFGNTQIGVSVVLLCAVCFFERRLSLIRHGTALRETASRWRSPRAESVEHLGCRWREQGSMGLRAEQWRAKAPSPLRRQGRG